MRCNNRPADVTIRSETIWNLDRLIGNLSDYYLIKVLFYYQKYCFNKQQQHGMEITRL